MKFTSLAAAVTIFAFMLVPYAASAQAGQSDLGATVRAALLSDPRTAAMSPAQLDAMVNALTQKAQAQGVTAHDIEWRPQAVPQESGSCSLPSFMCALNRAFGFDGSDLTIPVGLGTSAAVLLFVIGMMIEMRRNPHLFGMRSVAPSTGPTPAQFPAQGHA